ncbi:beta-ketoacyl-[acyl-carrier-protein] synthase family protein [soil metagenome]
MGVISAIGHSVEENRMSLVEGKSGIGKANLLRSKYTDLLLFAEVNITTSGFIKKLDVHDPGVTRTTLLALHAFEEAYLDAGLSKEQLSSSDTALINATTVGGMCLTDELYHDANKDEDGSPYLNSYDCASINLFLQQRFQLNGILDTINTACSSAANAIMYGARLIKSGRAKRAIVGGTDSLAKFTINGFNALHILSDEVCRPFDQNRKGLNLGEGAAFLVLEAEEDAKDKKHYASLGGYANTNDAFHASSLSDEGNGPFLAMKEALETAGLQPGDIDFINAHGTGTENNDAVESIAMLRLFEKPPAFSSTKGNTGHTLGAAGAVEAVYSILNVYYQELYPQLHFKEPITGSGLMPIDRYTKLPVQHVMSNSFGFGGNCSSLIFSKT